MILIILVLVLSFKFNKKAEDKITEEVSNEYIASYFDGEYQNEIPGKDDGYVVDKIVCDNGATATWDSEEWGINIRNATQKIKCSIYFLKYYDFDYTGTEQVFTVPKTGTYKIETWGAQGGNYKETYNVGGYSTGTVTLKSGENLFINVGGVGSTSATEKSVGGYNGGGFSYFQYGYKNSRFFSSGGGATHIALISGLLNTLEDSNEKILIVSGGGGGSFYGNDALDSGGAGGGYIGGNGTQHNEGWGTYGSGGTQSTGGYSYCDEYSCSGWKLSYSPKEFFREGSFGQGGNSLEDVPGTGGGGGYYGGGGAYHVQSAGGGSGYIGNSLLTNKAMYCYNCEESSEEDTKTISTTCAEETPTENCAKKGNGYARITCIG